ncbi:NAD(P)H-binding protein [Stenotrophomonas indicatrix]|uniref:NAD(P)H-binding protein n=1 Tax=Stenotrophomonas indicatrix TaxID=2045451 RepID=UPI000FD7F1C4|nr:NAD(P)H-binding protein [Stenotrophomonas indicatrix]
MYETRPLRILLTGATGLVGQGVARACLASPQVARTAALVRGKARLDARIEQIVLADFQHARDVSPQLAGFDACFYCAGAPPVGTAEDEYRKVTLDATVAVAAAWAEANPDGRFLYVSGAHANPHSRIMPLRIKGETEAALAQLAVRTVMLRPAGVRPVTGTGTRHAALKPLYRFGGPLMAAAGRVLPSLVTSNEAIGRAMIVLATMLDPPPVLECAQINRLGGAAAA